MGRVYPLKNALNLLFNTRDALVTVRGGGGALALTSFMDDCVDNYTRSICEEKTHTVVLLYTLK